MSNLKLKLLLLTAVALFVASVNTAHAYSNARHSNKQYSSNKSVSNKNSNRQYSSNQSSNKQYSNSHYSKPSTTSYQSKRYAQANYRSSSDVMHEVKQRYNAKVLKISLNEKTGVYLVRILMPNGKVRSLEVNARN